MMSDLIKRLRDGVDILINTDNFKPAGAYMAEAADEIESLRAQLAAKDANLAAIENEKAGSGLV